jgi:uncharacterized protein YdeI (YjbR/CyaY-like superfamily)
VLHFASGEAFRAWLERYHAAAAELWVGFWRKDSGKGGITYPEALDQALCFGWIDGVRVKVKAESYANRFTPRKPRSAWSAVNLKRYAELLGEGKVAPPGAEAFARRDGSVSQGRITDLAPAFRKRFREDAAAWAFWEAQPPGYRRVAASWVMDAKQEETRWRRLGVLLEDSRNGLRLALVTGARRPPRRRGGTSSPAPSSGGSRTRRRS